MEENYGTEHIQQTTNENIHLKFRINKGINQT